MDDAATHRLKFRELLRLSLRSFRQKPIRAVLTVLGMSVGIGAVLFLVSLGYGLQYILIGKLVTTEDSLITMEVYYPPESNLSVTPEELQALRDLPNVAEVSSVAEFANAEVLYASTSAFTTVRIVEPSYFRLTGISPDIGKPLAEGERSVILTSKSLELIGLPFGTSSPEAVGKDVGVKVFYQDDLNPLYNEESLSRGRLSVRGVLSDEGSPPTAILLSSSLEKEPKIYRSALVKAKSIDIIEALRDELIGKGFIVSARVDLVNQAKKITNFITIILGVFGITALVVSAIGMFNTMIVGFMERIYEVGILKSIGATDADVRNLFLMESSIMGFLGGAGGIFLGLGGGKLLNFGLSIVASKLGGKPFELFITPVWFIALIVALSIIIGLLSGFWPARRASHLSPKEAFIRK